MAKKGRPIGSAKKTGTTTVAVKAEHYEMLNQLAIGHNVSLGKIAEIVFAEGLKHLKIEDVVIRGKRIIFED